MTRRAFLGLLGCTVAGLATGNGTQAKLPKLPNIVYILADDMGWGDVSCNNPKSKIHTPHIDRLAAEGIRSMLVRDTAKGISRTLSLPTLSKQIPAKERRN